MSTSTSPGGRALTRAPAAVVRAALGAARVPLTVVEAVTGRRGSGWAPAVAFASVQASVLQLAGAALHDERLAEQGRAAQEAAAHTGRATHLDAAAAATQARARQRLGASVRAADRTVDEARQQAESSREQVERAEQDERDQVERTARSRQTQVRQRAEAEQKRRRSRERADRLGALGDAEQAQEQSESALQARETAALAEDALQTARARRRAD